MNLDECDDVWIILDIKNDHNNYITGAINRHPASNIQTFRDALLLNISLIAKN